MKKFSLNISHASSGQLRTIAAELKIMAHAWSKFGPRITLNSKAIEEPELRVSHASHKRQDASSKLQAKESYKREHGLK